jgi:hypothetical protein
MTHNKLAKVRRFALGLVLGNLALIALLALVLPESARAALPVLAIMLPPLSAAAIEGALSKQANTRLAARATRPSLGRALHHAA